MEIPPTGNLASAGAGLAQRPQAPEATALTKPAAAPAQAAAAVQQPSAVPDMDEVAHAVKNINSALKAQSQDLEFTVDTDTDRTIVKVVDRNTKEVLRQIPSEETLEIAKALDRVIGLIIRQKA